MRILHVTNSFLPTIGGVERLIDNVTKELEKQGHEVMIMSPEDDPSLSLYGGHIAFWNSLYVKQKNKTALGLLWNHTKVTEQVKEVVKNFKPDVVHFHSRHFALVSRAIRKTVKTVFTMHTTYFLHKKKKMWRKFLLNSFDVLFAHTKDYFETASEFEHKNLMYLANGIDLDKFHPSKRSEKWRFEQGFTDDDFVLLFVGRMVEYKVAKIPNILMELSKTHPLVKCVFVGDGPLRGWLEYETKVQKVDDKVVFTGFVPFYDLPKIYASCDMLIHTAQWGEVFGFVILEALASGLPVVATDFGAPSEMIEDWMNGLLFPLDTDFKGYAKNIGEMADSEVYDAMRDHARETSLRYSIEKHVRDFLWKIHIVEGEKK